MAITADWLDLWKSVEPLDLETFLQSDLLASRRGEIMFRVIAYRISGSVSFMASTCIAIHILRSHDGLSTTYHRLVMGLCITDMLSSFFIALSSLMVPKEMNYFVPHALGNKASCAAQGFFITACFVIATLYNCCICFYYLSIIKYNKNEEFIKEKLEPWFHGVTLSIPIVLCLVVAATKGFNTIGKAGPICFLEPNNPPHCIGRERGALLDDFHIPCAQGSEMINIISNLLRVLAVFIAPGIILLTMISMYRAVLKTEKKLQRYGGTNYRVSIRPGNVKRFSIRPMRSSFFGRASFFRSSTLFSSQQGNCDIPPLPLTNSSANGPIDDDDSDAGNSAEEGSKPVKSQRGDGEDDDQWGLMDKIKKTCNCLNPCCRPPLDEAHRSASTRSNVMKRHKRSVLHMSLAYSMAWVFVWIPFLLVSCGRSFPTEIINGIFTPLQGFYNFFVFMSPKVIIMKKKPMNKDINWLQAFAKAYMSRGSKVRKKLSLSSHSSHGTKSKSLRQLFKKSSSRFSSSRNFSTGLVSDHPRGEASKHFEVKLDEPQPDSEDEQPSGRRLVRFSIPQTVVKN
jgi:hypothetical protein